MQLTPPNQSIPSVRLTARNSKTGKSKTVTVYGVDEEQAIAEIERMIVKRGRKHSPESQSKPPSVTG